MSGVGMDPGGVRNTSKLLARKWQETDILKHHLRILDAKPSLENKEGKLRPQFNHLVKNPKKAMIEGKRASEIEKANMSLYMKMKSILLNSQDSVRIKGNPVHANFAPRNTNRVHQRSGSSIEQDSPRRGFRTPRRGSACSTISIDRDRSVSAASGINRQKYQLAINEENIKQLKRLQNQKAHINVVNYRDSERKRQKLLKQLAQQPQPQGSVCQILPRKRSIHSNCRNRNYHNINMGQTSSSNFLPRQTHTTINRSVLPQQRSENKLMIAPFTRKELKLDKKSGNGSQIQMSQYSHHQFLQNLAQLPEAHRLNGIKSQDGQRHKSKRKKAHKQSLISSREAHGRPPKNPQQVVSPDTQNRSFYNGPRDQQTGYMEGDSEPVNSEIHQDSVRFPHPGSPSSEQQAYPTSSQYSQHQTYTSQNAEHYYPRTNLDNGANQVYGKFAANKFMQNRSVSPQPGYDGACLPQLRSNIVSPDRSNTFLVKSQAKRITSRHSKKQSINFKRSISHDRRLDYRSQRNNGMNF